MGTDISPLKTSFARRGQTSPLHSKLFTNERGGLTPYAAPQKNGPGLRPAPGPPPLEDPPEIWEEIPGLRENPPQLLEDSPGFRGEGRRAAARCVGVPARHLGAPWGLRYTGWSEGPRTPGIPRFSGAHLGAVIGAGGRVGFNHIRGKACTARQGIGADVCLVPVT
jgi:hypothetical protein